MIESEVLEVRVGDVHVTPEQVADANIGTFGPDDYVLSTGRKLEAQVVTNNSVRVFDGVMVYGGIRDVISVNKYYDIQIDNGAQGMNRNDIIVRHFAITDEVTKRGGATFQVIKGTPSEGEAADPEIAFTDLRAGALSHDMILHRVRIEGLNIVAVEPLYDILYNAAELKEEVTELNRKFVFKRRNSSEAGICTPHYIMIIGTSVLQGANADYRQLFSTSDLLSKLKFYDPSISNFDEGKCVITTNNGDGNAAATHFYAPEWWGSNNAYYQYFYPGTSSPIRVNYCIHYLKL